MRKLVKLVFNNCFTLKTIGSWIYDNYTLSFGSNDDFVDTSRYIYNPIWDLYDVVVNPYTTDDRYKGVEYPSGSFPFSEDITFKVILFRIPLYFMINNIFPCLILNCVTLLIFFLPFVSQMTLCKFSFFVVAVITRYAIMTFIFT